MNIICEEISNTEQVQKALHGHNKTLLRVRRVGGVIPGLDVNDFKPCVLPELYKSVSQQIESFPIYKDDVIVASFPKSGTTWAQEMVWLIANDLDFNKAKQILLRHRYTFLEILGVVHNFIAPKTVETVQRPKFIKTHLPMGLLPIQFWTMKPKLIYIARNPKDIAISYYHHSIHIMAYKGTLDEFLDSFLNELIVYSSVHDHVFDCWRLKSEPNILFITYEEMSTNLVAVVHKVCEFLGKTYSDEQIDQLVRHLSFDEMRTNDAVNYQERVREQMSFYGDIRSDDDFKFFRRGQINSHVNEMPSHYQQKFDEWIKARYNESGYKFDEIFPTLS